jgi:hypothetical protein
MYYDANRTITHRYSMTLSARKGNDAGIAEAERLGGRQIDNEIKLGRLFDRDVARLRPAHNLVEQSQGLVRMRSL